MASDDEELQCIPGCKCGLAWLPLAIASVCQKFTGDEEGDCLTELPNGSMCMHDYRCHGDADA